MEITPAQIKVGLLTTAERIIMSVQSIVCPNCGQLDAIRRVYSIVTEGISVGSYQGVAPLQLQDKTYYFLAQRGMASSTLLAQRLAPPTRPEKPRDYKHYEHEAWWEHSPSSVKLINVGFMGVIMVFMAIGCIATLLILEVIRNLVRTSDDWLYWLLGIVIGMFLVIIVPAIVLAILVKLFGGPADISVVKQVNETSARIARARYSEALRQYEQWPQALAKWRDELYYCARCDGVFTKGSRFGMCQA